MTDNVAVQVRGYLTVFAALLVLTAVTVAVSYAQLPSTPAIALGVTIAVAKATLVAMFFMHLSHERRLIYMALILTAVLFIALIGLTLWSEAYHVPGTRFGPW
jgi:cytochrome c oxidase subunit IV